MTDTLPTPSTPNMVALMRVQGAHEEILEGYGKTTLYEVFYQTTEKAQALVASGPRFQYANGATPQEE